jgi:hypothetical protein
MAHTQREDEGTSARARSDKKAIPQTCTRATVAAWLSLVRVYARSKQQTAAHAGFRTRFTPIANSERRELLPICFVNRQPTLSAGTL